jgi:hypothetical protein
MVSTLSIWLLSIVRAATSNSTVQVVVHVETWITYTGASSEVLSATCATYRTAGRSG